MKNKSRPNTRSKNPPQPPQRNIALVCPFVFRYLAQSALTREVITRGDALNALVMGNVTTTNYRMIQAIRVTRLQLWDPSTGATTPDNPASIVWDGTTTQHEVYSDIAVGTANAAYIDTRPPATSNASFVSETGISESEELFDITCGPGAVLDMHCVITLASDSFVGATVTTSASNAATIAYFNALDGTTNLLRAPLGLRTTA